MPNRKTPQHVGNAQSEQRVPDGLGRFVAEASAAARERAASGNVTPTIIGIDGRSGSGKSTLARSLAAEFAGSRVEAPIVQLDQLCPGWHGLDRAVDLVTRWVLRPIAEPAHPSTPRYRRWDWYLSRYAEWVEVPSGPGAVVIVEGCGIGSARARKFLDTVVWIDASEPIRRGRALAREHEFLAQMAEKTSSIDEPRDPLWWWQLWAAQEEEILARERTKTRADFVVSGS